MILLVILSRGDDPFLRYAIVPKEKLDDYNLAQLQGCVINEENMRVDIMEQIELLYKRLGLEDSPDPDLEPYLVKVPIEVALKGVVIENVITFGWTT